MYFEQFRSGTEEEYDDLKSLLEDITTFCGRHASSKCSQTKEKGRTRQS